MKKIILICSVFLIVMKGVCANENDYYINVNGKNYLYQNMIINNRLGFNLFIEEEIEIKESRIINNLAYIANLKNNDLYSVVIQMLIWQKIYPHYSFYIEYNNRKVNVDNIIKEIDEMIANFDKDPDIKDKYYQIDYEKKLKIITNVNLASYYLEDCSASITGNSAELSLFHVGLKKIHFLQKELKRRENYIYADEFYYKPFTIMVDVKANIVNLNFIMDEEKYNFKYGIFDQNGNLLKVFDINNHNNKIYFKKGSDVYLKELTEDSIYELSENILLQNKDQEYSIDIYKKKKMFNIIINTLLFNYGDKEIFEKTYTDVSIYNKNMQLIQNTKCIEYCKFNLEADSYIFEDNISKYKLFVDLTADSEIFLQRYYINSILTFEKVENIYKGNDNIAFEQNENFINFIDFVLPEKYTIIINGKKYVLNLSDNNNYIYLNDYGLVYFYQLENLEENDNIINKNETSSDDSIIIKVPDTNLEYQINKEYIYVKKKNMFYISYSFVNFFV